MRGDLDRDAVIVTPEPVLDGSGGGAKRDATKDAEEPVSSY